MFYHGEHSCGLENNVYSTLLNEAVYKSQLDPVDWWFYSVWLIFCLLSLSITDAGVLKSITVDLFIILSFLPPVFGPVINKVLERHGGGGHALASGAKLKTFEQVDALVKDLDELCKNYKEGSEKYED